MLNSNNRTHFPDVRSARRHLSRGRQSGYRRPEGHRHRLRPVHARLLSRFPSRWRSLQGRDEAEIDRPCTFCEVIFPWILLESYRLFLWIL